MISPEIIGEFLQETSEILDGMTSLIERVEAGSCPVRVIEELERGLHTIKGNAATFGFAEFATAAGHVLDRLRDTQLEGDGNGADQGPSPDARASVLLVKDFVERGKGYLTQGSKAGNGYFERIVVRCSESRADPGQPRSGDPTRTASSMSDEVRDLLNGAPVVRPNVDDLVRMAIQELSANAEDLPSDSPAESAPQPTDAPSISTETELSESPEATPGGSSRIKWDEPSDPHGFAMEAAFVVDSLTRSLRGDSIDCGLRGFLSGSAQILASYYRSSVRQRAVTLLTYVRESITWAERHSASLGLTLTAEIDDSRLSVVPGLGRLVRAVIKEVFLAVVSAADKSRGVQLTARVHTETEAGTLIVSLSGLSGFRGAAKLQLYLLQQRIEKSGVSIGPSPAGDEILVRLPSTLDSMEMLVVRAGRDRLGIPAHRVLGVVHHPDAGCLDGNEWVEIDGRALRLMDLTGREGSRQHEHLSSLVVVQTGIDPVALRVADVCEQQEVIVWMCREGGLQDDAMGLSISRRGLEFLPVLWWSSRFFQVQEQGFESD